MISDRKSFTGQLQFQSKDAEMSKFFSSQQDQDNEGKNIKGSHSWKILHQDNETKTWKKAIVGSSASNSEENVSTKDKGTVDDIVVVDYAQPHRKPPIHNKGT
ncbi:hypothetical protein AAHA92_10037 [Salvia divinorum]|uniref:Uncharacterized protein n=1 Tax=Salvia divinorum TaxID=28513 RepID=A0ABD1HVY9_SALDI